MTYRLEQYKAKVLLKQQRQRNDLLESRSDVLEERPSSVEHVGELSGCRRRSWRRC